MEPELAFTLCGLGICFLIPAFILGFINRSKTTRCTVTTVATAVSYTHLTLPTT